MGGDSNEASQRSWSCMISEGDDDVVVKLFRLPSCRGLPEQDNELLYLPPLGDRLSGYVVFFPGDAQDVHQRMVAAGHAKWSQYSLERTARLLAQKFPEQGVLVVVPTKHVDGGLASYDNFARTERASGGSVPKYLVGGSASSHLEALLNTAADLAASSAPPVPAPSPDGVDCRFIGIATLLDASLPLTLVGFSKGAIVLNQLVTELAGEALETHCFGTHQCSGKEQCVVDNGRPGRSSRKRRRAASEKLCSGCGTSAALSARAFGRTSRKGKPKEAPTRSSAVFDFLWFQGDDERSNEGEVRLKKEDRARRGLNKDYPQARHEQDGFNWAKSSCSTTLSPCNSVDTLSITSLASTTDEYQANHDYDDGDWKDEQGPNFVHVEANSGGDVDSIWTRSEVDQRQRVHDNHATEGRDHIDREAEIITPTKSMEYGKRGASWRGVHTVPQAGAPVGEAVRSGQSAASARRLFDRVVAVHWVDGGNGNLTGSFPDNLASLTSLASRRTLAVRVHGTPYQWSNACRPWLSDEKDAFLATLEALRKVNDARDIASAGCPSGGRLTGSTDLGVCAVHSPPFLFDVGVSAADGVCGGCDDGDGKQCSAGRDLGVKSWLYFGEEAPSLDVHFEALREFNPE